MEDGGRFSVRHAAKSKTTSWRVRFLRSTTFRGLAEESSAWTMITGQSPNGQMSVFFPEIVESFTFKISCSDNLVIDNFQFIYVYLHIANRDSRIANYEYNNGIMKKHTGMRPHDIVILLKVAAKGEKSWFMKDLAYELGISQSEVSESLHRSSIAGLISSDKKQLMRAALLEFMQYGMKYVFPQQPGPIVRGMPTAHSAPPLNKEIKSQDVYVWPWAEGQYRGQTIEPLHPSVPEACEKDDALYELLSVTDAIRIGKAREQSLAIKLLNDRI